MKKKRVLAILASLALTAGIGVAGFTGCSSLGYFVGGSLSAGGPFAPNPNETFESKVSEGEYASVDEAAAAFIEKEVSGSEHQYAMTDYTKQRELSSSEISQLNLEAQVDGEIESVEKGKVKYSEVSAIAKAALPVAAATHDVEITVYIIKFTPNGKEVSSFKYVVALPENDEPIPYSYLCDVMDPAKYTNCTVESSSTTGTVIKADGQTVSTTENANFSILIVGNVAKLELSLSVTSSVGEPLTQNVTAYLAEVEGTLKIAAEYNGVYTATEVSSIGLAVDEMSDLFSSQIDQSQCSMYVKTSEGFKLADQFMEDMINGLMDAFGVSTAGVEPSITTKNEYKVVDGRLSKAEVTMSVELARGADSFKVISQSEVTYSNFGTTTVTVPEEVKALLGIQ